MKITKGYKPCQYPGCTCQAYGRLSVIKYCPAHKKIVAVEQSKQSRQRIREYNEAKKRVRNYKPKICGICGKEFVPNTGTQKYCSDECTRKSRNIGARKRRSSQNYVEGRKCLVCGKVIKNCIPSQKYCIGACRRKADAMLKAKRYAEFFESSKPKKVESKKPAITVDMMAKISAVVWEKHHITLQYGELSKYTDDEKIELLNGRRPWR